MKDAFKKKLLKMSFFRAYFLGKEMLNHPMNKVGRRFTEIENAKVVKRTEVLNFLLKQFNVPSYYLEIGVRNPDSNFNLIDAEHKYSADPGVEFEENPVDFKLTSDDFFKKLDKGEILKSDILFDLIFIDGLHLAEQVNKDIENALRYLKPNGFIVLHDCNPPTEWHAREEYNYQLTPAEGYWNGTTWKAYVKARNRKDISACCIDSDWGIGVLSKTKDFQGLDITTNEFYEYKELEKNRKSILNLITFEEFKLHFS